MTDVINKPLPTETPDETSNGLFAKYAGLPAPIRWMTAAALGILVLSIVQEISGEGSSVLTEPGTSGAMLRFAVPILLAGLGGLFSERAGVVNIGLEGMMIMGTWFGAWGTVNFGSPWAGLVCAAVGGGLGGLLHAVATVSFGVDHIISGVAINILAPGLTRFLSDQVFNGWEGGSITQSPRAVGLPKIDVPLLAGRGGSTSVLGDIDDKNWFFVSDVAGFLEGAMQGLSLFTIIAFLLVPISGFVLWRTRLGLRIRICGERPEAGESLGVNIYLHKYIGVITSGAFAGLAGGFIAMELAGIYREGQTLGRGFIGLAALIFGNWRPGGVMLGSLLFGYPFVLALRDSAGLGTRALLLVIGIALIAVLVYSVVNQNQTDAIIAGVLAVAMLIWWSQSSTAPNWLPNTMPYATVLLVLVFMSQRLRMPAADGQIYRKGG
ncbi:MAG: ABC transporter permease [Ilumatobacter sp.]|uniref:ABC transporter permease n=1 Tax=Ilumatobacter sp. TaxID=1967498 RepID=UPI003C715284